MPTLRGREFSLEREREREIRGCRERGEGKIAGEREEGRGRERWGETGEVCGGVGEEERGGGKRGE